MVARLTLPDMVYGVTPQGGPDLRFILFTVSYGTGEGLDSGTSGVLFGAWEAAGTLVPLVFGAWESAGIESDVQLEDWSNA